MSEVGKKIRAARIEKGLTLQNVADTLGIRTPSVAQIESGRTLPAADRLPALADLLGIDVVELAILEATDRGRIIIPDGVGRDAVRLAFQSILSNPVAAQAPTVPQDPHDFECPKCGARLKAVEKSVR